MAAGCLRHGKDCYRLALQTRATAAHRVSKMSTMSNSETHPPMERRCLWRWLAAVAVVAAAVGLRAPSGVVAHSTVRVPLPMVDWECTSGQGPRPCKWLGMPVPVADVHGARGASG